jgi:hypothetical protein
VTGVVYDLKALPVVLAGALERQPDSGPALCTQGPGGERSRGHQLDNRREVPAIGGAGRDVDLALNSIAGGNATGSKQTPTIMTLPCLAVVARAAKNVAGTPAASIDSSAPTPPVSSQTWATNIALGRI